MQASLDWLGDPNAVKGGVGEKSLRQILDYALKVADRSLPADRDSIRKMCGDISSMADALCELRANGQVSKTFFHQFYALSHSDDLRVSMVTSLVDQSAMKFIRGSAI